MAENEKGQAPPAPTGGGGSVIIIKKVKGGAHGGGHGGAWKVAFADFMTAMMCFFLVMWLMASDDETKAAIADYFKNPSSAWRLEYTSTKSVPLGDKTAAGQNILVGQDGLVPEDLLERPSRPFVPEPKPLAPLEDVVEDMLEKPRDLEPMSMDELRFSIAENKLFIEGTDQLSPDGEKYLEKIGRMTKRYAGYLVVGGTTGPYTGAAAPEYDESGMAKPTAVDPYEALNARIVQITQHLVEQKLVDEDRAVSRIVTRPADPDRIEPLRAPANESRIEFVISRSKKG